MDLILEYIHKVWLTPFFIVIISVLSVYFFMTEYEYLYTVTENEATFYSADFDPFQKKILIIGSSQIFPVNMTYINQEISKKCADCVVYNLGKGADNPQKRLKTINFLNSIKPDLVIYVVSYRDYANLNQKGVEIIQIKTPKSELPDPQEFFHKEILFKTFNTDINPKLFTLKFLNGNLVDEKTSSKKKPDPNSLQLRKPLSKNHYQAFSNEELKEFESYRTKQLAKIDPYAYYKNSNALEEIISELKENGSEVVIITPPLPKVFLDNVSDSDKELFRTSLQNISNRHIVNIFYLDEKFSDMKIWFNTWHVTASENGFVYTKEISNIIKKSLKDNAI